VTASPIANRSPVLSRYGRCETLRKRKQFVVDGAHLTREKVAEMLNFQGVVAITREPRKGMVNRCYDPGNFVLAAADSEVPTCKYGKLRKRALLRLPLGWNREAGIFRDMR
jgi:hypothetical protein